MTVIATIEAELVVADGRFLRSQITAGWSIARAAIRSALVALAPAPEGVLVDLGSGPGSAALDCSRVDQVIRVDREGQGANVTADLEQRLPFDDHVFDAATLFHVLEHIEQHYALLSEIRRITKVGGLVVLEVPFVYPIHGSPHDIHRFTGTALPSLLGRAGFGDVRLAAAVGPFLAAAVPLGEVVPARLRRLLATAAAGLDRRPSAHSRSTWWPRYVVGYAGGARAC